MQGQGVGKLILRPAVAGMHLERLGMVRAQGGRRGAWRSIRTVCCWPFKSWSYPFHSDLTFLSKVVFPGFTTRPLQAGPTVGYFPARGSCVCINPPEAALI